MSLRAEVTIERFGRSGRESRRFPSRSFLIGLIQLLYVQHSALSIDNNFFPSCIAELSSSPFDLSRGYNNLIVCSPGGIDGFYQGTTKALGDEIGIQIGTGSKALSSGDRSLDRRIAPHVSRMQRVLSLPWDTVNSRSQDIAWDGTYLWVCLQNPVGSSSRIYQIDPHTGAEIKYVPAPGTSYSYNRGLTYDGTYLWVTGYDSGLSPVYRVYQISTVDGSVQNNWGAPNAHTAWGLAWDGTYVWVVEYYSNQHRIHQCATADGAIQKTLDSPWGLSVGMNGITYDGTYLWVLGDTGRSYGRKEIAQIDTNGVLQKKVFTPVCTSGTSYDNPQGLTWVDPFLWLSSDYYYTALRWRAAMQLCVNPVKVHYSGCEVVDDESYVNPNGSFTLRRYFTNKSGGAVSVSEVGITATPEAVYIARDLVSPAVNVLNNETLKVEYTFQITV